MSSTESSGAPAEGPATPSAANPAAASSFGHSRGSGLARGKRPSVGPAASNNAPASDYKPTAIEVVNAPREYQNPFAPTPATPATPSVSEAPLASHGPVAAPSPATAAPQPSGSAESAQPDVTANELGTAPTPPPARPVRPARSAPPPATTSGEDLFPLDPAAPRAGNADEKAELNILPPERPKSVAPQTWESEGFRPQQREGREVRPERADRPERTERPERTDRPDRPRRDDRFGGERREREGNRAGFEPREGREHSRRPERGEFRREESSRPSPTPSPAAQPAPAKTGGFLGWLKSLFGGAEETKPVMPAREPGYRPGGRDGGHGQRQHRAGGGGGRGGQRQHRGGGYGHGSGQGGENPAGGPEGQSPGGEHRGGDREGFRRRRRGGRGRGQYRGEGRGGDHRGGGGESHPQA